MQQSQVQPPMQKATQEAQELVEALEQLIQPPVMDMTGARQLIQAPVAVAWQPPVAVEHVVEAVGRALPSILGSSDPPTPH